MSPRAITTTQCPELFYVRKCEYQFLCQIQGCPEDEFITESCTWIESIHYYFKPGNTLLNKALYAWIIRRIISYLNQHFCHPCSSWDVLTRLYISELQTKGIEECAYNFSRRLIMIPLSSCHTLNRECSWCPPRSTTASNTSSPSKFTHWLKNMT